MFVIQSFTSFRVPKTLGNAILILIVSFNGIVCWQLWRYFGSDRDYEIGRSCGAIGVWFLSALALGRHYYGYLKIA